MPSRGCNNRRVRRRRVVLALQLSLLLLAACESRDHRPPSVVFTPGAAPAASSWQLEPRDLLAQPPEPPAAPWSLSLVGADGVAEQALVEGIAAPESAEGTRFVWAIGERSRLRFRLDQPENLRLELRARPFAYPGAPPQRVTLSLNGDARERFELATGNGDHTIAIPSSALRRGWNELTLAHAWSVRPRDVREGSLDARPLAAAYEHIRLVQTGPLLRFGTAAIDGREAAPALSQMGRGSVSWVFRAPPDATLDVSWLAPPNAAAMTVRAAIETDDGARLLWEEGARSGASGRRSARLEDFSSRPVRLELEVIGAPTEAPWLWADVRIDAPASPSVATAPALRGQSVLFILLDASQRTRFGVYGNPRVTTPHIDELARDSLVFDAAHATAPYTLSSTASLFTSLLPPQHGVVEKANRLAQGVPTLAEAFRAAGYATAAFSANGFVSRHFGLTRGFEDFVTMSSGRGAGTVAPAQKFHAPVTKWLDEHAAAARSGQQPFFLYLHYVQPHEPFDIAPSRFYDLDPSYDGSVDGSLEMLLALYDGKLKLTPRDVEQLERLYEGNLRYADDAVGQLLAELKRLGLFDRTLVVVTSDHGESLGERGLFGHNTSVDQAMTAIPLVVHLPASFPGRRAGRSDVPVSTIDLGPLVLEASGIDPPENFAGRSPLPFALTGTSAPPRLLYARTAGGQPEVGLWDLDWKCRLAHGAGDGLAGPVDAVDAGAAEARARNVTLSLCTAARRALESAASPAAQATGTLSEQEREALKALGYLHD
jgi:arylsulfatase A-like enzyme